MIIFIAKRNITNKITSTIHRNRTTHKANILINLNLLSFLFCNLITVANGKAVILKTQIFINDDKVHNYTIYKQMVI